VKWRGYGEKRRKIKEDGETEVGRDKCGKE
jgi:hypothetical protein